MATAFAPSPAVHATSSAPQSGALPTGHLPALDGLRGLAVLLVMFAHFTDDGGIEPYISIDHAFLNVALYGWMGVDLFFVLSGFLITGILVDARGSASYFRTFYIRRTLRIFPLYYGFLLVWFFILPAIYVWPDGIDTRASQFWSWTYTTNILQAFQNDLDAAPTFTGHFWSLAVEEQFYLVWPFAVLLCSRRGLVWLSLGCVAAAPVVRYALHSIGAETAAYVLMPARMDSLALGAILALLWRDPTWAARMTRWAPAAAAVGLASAIATMLADPPATSILSLWVIGNTELAIGFGGLLIWAITGSTRAGPSRLFRRPLLRFFGKHSYAMYVFHLPVAFFVSQYGFFVSDAPKLWDSQLPAQFAFFAAAGGITVALSLLSWHAFERPFLRLKDRWQYSRGVCARA